MTKLLLLLGALAAVSPGFAWETKSVSSNLGWTTTTSTKRRISTCPSTTRIPRTSLFLSDSASGDDDWYSGDFVPPPRRQEAPFYGGGGEDRRPRYQQDRGSSYRPSSSSSSGGPRRDSYSSSSRGGGGGGYSSNNRRSGGGGGGGGRIEYSRDTSRDTSNVDVAAVESLLEARQQARQRRDFDAADALRDQLLQQHSVAVSDRDASWRTGASDSGSGRQWQQNNNNGNDRFGGDRRSQRDSSRGGGRRTRDFGPNGHDYEKSSDAGANLSDLTDEQIHDLLAQRLQAKMSRDFDTADGIQYELLNAGVFVHDSIKEWRADGVPFSEMGGSGPRAGTGRNDRRGGREERPERKRKGNYEQSQYSPQVAQEDADQIARLVAKRARCKEKRQYDEADSIIEVLRNEYNVHVDDRLREWSVGGDFGEEANRQREMSELLKHRGHVQSASSKGLSPADEATVTELLEARSQAKKDRNFKVADDIRDQLLDDFDVYLQDKSKLWSVGGDFTSEGGGVVRNELLYQREGGGGQDLTEDDLISIADLIWNRAKARKDRDYADADVLSDVLYEKYKVRTDDSNKLWWIETEGFSQEPATANARVLDEEEIATVEGLLNERLELKMDRNFEAADAIRDELLDVYSVVVNDRMRSWRTLENESAGYGNQRGSRTERSGVAAPQQPVVNFEDDDEVEEDVVAGFNDADDEEATTTDDFIMSREELTSLTIPELKEKLRSAGKPVSGKKAELVDRLLN